MTNILEAIVNIANNPVVAIRNHYTGRNRANNVGEALEMFVKDAFANTIQEQDDQPCSITPMPKICTPTHWQELPPDPPCLVEHPL